MNSNYQWQKQQTNQRLQARYQEAAAHRLAKQAKPNRPNLIVRMIRQLSGNGRPSRAALHGNSQAAENHRLAKAGG